MAFGRTRDMQLLALACIIAATPSSSYAGSRRLTSGSYATTTTPALTATKCPYMDPQDCIAYEEILKAASPTCPPSNITANLHAACNITLENQIYLQTVMPPLCVNGRITEFNYVSPNVLCPLNGTMSPYYGNLSEVTGVTIVDPQFTGTIPPEMTQMKKFTQLTVHQPGMTGPLPIFNTSQVTILNIDLQANLLVNTTFDRSFIEMISNDAIESIVGFPMLDKIIGATVAAKQQWWREFLHYLDVPPHSLPAPDATPNCTNLKCDKDISLSADCRNACRMMLSLGVGNVSATYDNQGLLIFGGDASNTVHFNGTFPVKRQAGATKTITFMNRIANNSILWGRIPPKTHVQGLISTGPRWYMHGPLDVCDVDWKGHAFDIVPGILYNTTLTLTNLNYFSQAPSCPPLELAAPPSPPAAPARSARALPDNTAAAITIAVVLAALLCVAAA
jgi:hypothetical protein